MNELSYRGTGNSAAQLAEAVVTEGGVSDWLDRLDKAIASCEHEWHQLSGGIRPILSEDVPSDVAERAVDYSACEIAARIERAVGQISFLQRNIEGVRNRVRI
jgi:hypothetical protein